MGNLKFKAIVAGSALLILVFAAAVGAQHRNRSQFRRELAGNFGIRQFVRSLELSIEQREAIRAILQANKPQIAAARENLLRARIALFNEEADAPGDFGAAQARIMELRRAIADQIESELTPEQLAALQDRQRNRMDILNRRLQRFRELGAN
ncbi:MAG: hypothetical protein JW793_07800 [Acidobacteria bacterium]|nr:hypothetical protein [Acidobacteriota bacterium]